MNNDNGNYDAQKAKYPSASNKDLVSEIAKDAEHMRNYRIYGYLGELQKQKLEPISVISNELILIGAAECPFYKHKEMTGRLKGVKGNFAGIIKEVNECLQDYVISPQDLVNREQMELDNTKTVLRDL